MSFIGKQVKNHVCNFNTHNNHNNNNKSPYGTWKCESCNLIFEIRAELFKHKREVHPIQKSSVWNKGLTKETDSRVAKYVNTRHERGYISPFKGKHLSEEHKCKTSMSMKKFYKEYPELTPYKLHHSSKESYPERYFTKLFNKENIVGYIKEYIVNGYFLDFAFVELKIDFEVDGSQHYVDPRIVEHDKVRTKVLNDLGWTIIRLDWRQWQKMNKSARYEWIANFKVTLEKLEYSKHLKYVGNCYSGSNPARRTILKRNTIL